MMKRIGVLTGGGDCPGLNAVIRAVTKSLIHQGGVDVVGIESGFAGLMQGPHVHALEWRGVSDILATGGTVLGTSNRANPLQNAEITAGVVSQVHALGLDAIVAIGGDGTMTIAQELSAHGLRFVGVPKTIDNDIEGCERSFGFDTAVATVTDALERVQTTGQSHGRVMIVETMGRHAGWIALEGGIAGAADVILLPEIQSSLPAIAALCREREARERYTVICIAEGARLDSAPGLSTDAPQPGSVGHALRERLQPLLTSEVRCTVLGHLQRGGSPTPFDRVLATQYGNEAVSLLLAGDVGRMVTLQGGRLTSVALCDVAHRTRRVPPDHPLVDCARRIGVSFGESASAC